LEDLEMEQARAESSTPTKRRYAEPVLTEVLLRPEDAVLGNCKIAGTAGPLQGDCVSPATCYGGLS
jgi:hypothetical protein